MARGCSQPALTVVSPAACPSDAYLSPWHNRLRCVMHGCLTCYPGPAEPAEHRHSLLVACERHHVRQHHAAAASLRGLSDQRGAHQPGLLSSGTCAAGHSCRAPSRRFVCLLLLETHQLALAVDNALAAHETPSKLLSRRCVPVQEVLVACSIMAVQLGLLCTSQTGINCAGVAQNTCAPGVTWLAGASH